MVELSLCYGMDYSGWELVMVGWIWGIASLADHFGGRRVSINAHDFTATALYFTVTAYATVLYSTLQHATLLFREHLQRYGILTACRAQ